MSTIKVAIGAKPTTTKPSPPSRDAWVESRKPEAEPTKQLMLDVPANLHARITAPCATRRTKMVDKIRVLLDEKFRLKIL